MRCKLVRDSSVAHHFCSTLTNLERSFALLVRFFVHFAQKPLTTLPSGLLR